MKTVSTKAAILAGALTFAAGIFPATSAQAAAGGTDILHFSVIKAMTDNGIKPGADGIVVATQKEQGNADNQTLDIAVIGLDTNTTYELMAVVDTDTNLVDVTSFTTGDKGRALLEYRDLGNGHGGGKGHTTLPSSLNPVSLIRELDVVDTNLQAVLTADLTMPDKLQYLIKRNLSTNSIKAELHIEATTRATHFELLAEGLAPTNSYLLVFNGDVVQTNSTSAKGRLDLHAASETPPNILDLRSVELWDNSSNVVLQTSLP